MMRNIKHFCGVYGKEDKRGFRSLYISFQEEKKEL
jgi:hypothetical protein